MSDPFAADQDVRNVLGTVGNRLPAWIVIARYLSIAHATVVDRLARAYPNGIPTFEGDAADVVSFAEAKLAAAEILEAIRVNLPDLGDAPDRLRDSAFSSIDDGVVGYPIGSSDVPGGDPAAPAATSTPGPRVSSFTPLSAFPDPYEPARDPAIRFQ